MIAAEARDHGVTQLNIRWSYPQAFAFYMIEDLQTVWESLARDGNQVGLNIAIERSETESVAGCKYMVTELGAGVAAKTRAQIIVDIGGGTSDIAIWLDNDMKAQSSLLLAGDILSEYAEKYGPFSEAIVGIADFSGVSHLMKDHSRCSGAMNLLFKAKRRCDRICPCHRGKC